MIYLTCDEKFSSLCMKLDLWLEFQDDRKKKHAATHQSCLFVDTGSPFLPTFPSQHPELITNLSLDISEEPCESLPAVHITVMCTEMTMY